MNKNPKVNLYFNDGCGKCKFYKTEHCKVHFWQKELQLLREILLETELEEDIKWKQPCYTYDGKNVVIISAFKDNCVLSLLKGVLLKDGAEILEKPGENSQSVRFVRFTNAKKIIELRPVLLEYLKEAIAIEKSGKKVVLKKESEQEIPEELLQKLTKDLEYKTAFEALTSGRKRSYYLYFNAAKQAKTRENRVENAKEKIILGKGWNEY